MARTPKNIMKITRKTQCHNVCEYIIKHYGEVENQAITIIYEQFANLMDGCGYPEDFERNPPVGEVVDLLKDFQAWETAWIAGKPLPFYNECGFCYPIAA